MSTNKRLAELYYELISQDHHKDRDCHFHIEHRISSYGDDRFSVIHYGYINEFDEEVSSYEEALITLNKKIKEIITNEANHAIMVNENPEEYDQHVVTTERAKEILKEIECD